jgi:ferredoxin
MKVVVDGALCTGHGRCYSLAPDVFEPDDEGYNAQRDTRIDVPAGEEEPARHGAHSCPEGAITVIET